MTSVDRWLLPDGVEELLPAQAAQVEALRRQLLDLYKRWGYELVIPPMLEYTESLLVGLGSDIDLLTFRVTDQLTGRMMGLRADITPQAARIDAHSLGREGPVRLCYAGSVLHSKPKKPLASRSPIQLGAELYGDNSPASDLEIICLMLETLRVAGLNGITLDTGHVGVYRAVIKAAGLNAEQESTYFDILQRKAKTELLEFVAALSVEDKVAVHLLALNELHGDADVLVKGREAFADIPEAINAIASLEQLTDALAQRIPDLQFYFDLAELRGYHYHTGVVFSALVREHGQALASGGRYDDIGEVFGRARPATGFSIDLKALLGLLPPVTEAAAIFAPYDPGSAQWQFVQSLRESGEKVICGLPGQDADAACDRVIRKEKEQWCVVSLN
ncbi:ATP phosphoribosyltransferase regulatory subunit [Zhongshania aliphaticivorans]|uniref:ATP phosphoribosyltransferase regulatory subunit n=1 Tax=Zhongshania aliphaticivorans TaxID=1470434 RepID=A0A5S9N4F0_9GAMM|nr:ATP phosphoribosyltransferase regulatory subunit [Zhongshania aliphaticivorans]CAA0081960.1 ATP phosphoribosyltransferase regulatory subunit [Zhongshania aliphaticivorans]CAA0084655.1 ATP phosphoribosyltransferase regulatory subunit [Zhongshania aliphaticivorans]